MSNIVRTDFDNNEPPSPNAGYLNHLGQVVNSKIDGNFRLPIVSGQTPTNIEDDMFLTVENGYVVGGVFDGITRPRPPDPPDEQLGPVTNITVTPSVGTLTLRWRDPEDTADATWERTVLRRKEGSHPLDEHDGVLVVSSTVRNQFHLDGLVDTGLVNGREYFYRFVPISTQGVRNMSSANFASGIPKMPAMPLGPVSNISITSGNGFLDLRWTDPDNTADATWESTMIRRKEGSHPVNHEDGVHVGTNFGHNHGQTVGIRDSGLVNGTEYFYRFIPRSTDGVRNLEAANLGRGMPGVPLGTKAIGDIINIRVNGVRVPAWIIHRGNPGAMYRGFTNTTTVMVPTSQFADRWDLVPYTNDRNYSTSRLNLHSVPIFVNEAITSTVRNNVVEVRVPYFDPTPGVVMSGDNGLLCRAFMLSVDEIGIRSGDIIPAIAVPFSIGSKFDYFMYGISAEADNLRRCIANWTGTFHDLDHRGWTRSPNINIPEAWTWVDGFNRTHPGTLSSASLNTIIQNVFAFALRNDTLLDNNDNIIGDEIGIGDLSERFADVSMAFDALLGAL